MIRRGIVCVVTGFFVIMTAGVFADNVDDLLKSAAANYKAKKYAKALSDLDWAKREISQKQLELVKAQLPESLPGFTTNDISGEAMLGIHNVSREYVKGDQRIKVSIGGSASGGAAAGIGAIFGMAAALGAMDAGTKSNMVIVQGRKGQFNLDQSGTGTLVFTLKNNVFVNIETHGFDNVNGAKLAAEKMNFDAIEALYE